MGDWLLRVYNAADIVPFIEAFRKMAGKYYPNKINVCKDAVSIPDISITYVLNKSLEKDKRLELYSPGDIWQLCWDKREELHYCSCDGVLKCGGYCEECLLDMSVSPGKVWVWKDSRLRAVKDRHGERASASFYKVSWKRHHTHKTSWVSRKG